MRHNLLGAWLFVCFGAHASFGQGLTPATPAKEYIRLNGSVVAIENAPAPAAPTIAITSPASGATVTGSSVTVGVSVGGTITSVQLKVDGANVGAPMGYPYTLTFDSTRVLNGSHSLIATAVGPAGMMDSVAVAVTVDNTSVSITSPAPNAPIAGASVPITVLANGSVTSVQLQVDGLNRGSPATVSPFGLTLDTTALSNGPHTLTAVAASSIGPVTSSPVSVTVANISVAITQPAAGATIAASTPVTFSVTGPVTSVQLRVNNANWGNPATVSPFGVTLDTTTLSNGSHSLIAVATGPAGDVFSAAVAVTVNNLAPTTAFLTGFSSNTVRSNYTGFAGMLFTVGNTALSVTDLGRMYISGGGTHIVKLVLASSGVDVPGGSVSVAGGTAGKFTYAALSSPVTLLANTGYYVVSQETEGGDPWWESGPVSPTSAASIVGPVFLWNGSWIPANGLNQSYVPANFKYAVSTPPVSVSITGPVAGGTVSGATAPVTVSTTGAVASVQLQVDGVNKGSAATTAPFGLTFDTTTVGNGSHYLIAIASDGAGGMAYSLPVSVNVNNTYTPPPGTPFVTAFSPGAARNNYTGFVGMQFTVGGTSLTVTELGRMYVSGSGTHLLKLVLASNGTDVSGGSVLLSIGGGTPGQFQYGTLVSAVILAANTTYYLVSQETAGGDAWYDSGPVATTSVASVGGPVLGTPISGLPRQTYVPMNFQYAASTPSISVLLTAPAGGATISGANVAVTVATSGSVASVQLQVDGANVGSPATTSPFSSTLNTTALSNGSHTLTTVASDGAGGTAYSLPVAVTVSNVGPSTAFVTGFSAGTTRNNYTGYVGMQFTVGATPLTVTQLGRLYLSGSGTHTLKLVTATTGVDVAGGSVPVSGGAAGQFQYASLTSPVTLAANTAYYVVSGETSGGDLWYDDDTTITATSVASLGGPVYGIGGPGNWTPIGTLVGKSFVPVNFKYQTGAPPAMTIAITAPTGGATISGVSVAVTVATSGPVASVQLQVDGVNKGSPATSAPFNLTLDTTVLSNGSHTLTAVASDGGGGTVTSAGVSVTVNNAPPPTGTAFVTSFGTSATRTDFDGFVGMGFTVGAAPITVTQLGRLYVSGSGTHTLKLVVASTGVDVPGGSASLSIGGGTPGQFQYASLGVGVTLAANTAYYVVSQEMNGGDPWHDWITVTTTSAGTGNGPVYELGTYTLISSLAGKAYGPVNFKY